MNDLLDKLEKCASIQTHPASYVMPQTLVKEGVYIEFKRDAARELIEAYLQFKKEEDQ